MSRRPFDASFSRRPGHGGGGGGSLMGDYPGQGYDEIDSYGSAGSGGGGGGGVRSMYEEYEQQFDRIPRDAVRAKVEKEYQSSGGWRQRSPSPRYDALSRKFVAKKEGSYWN